MRTLPTFATLLLGLAVVFWAPAAKAHCPHGNDENHSHCDGGEPPQEEAKPAVVRDSNGNLVGIYIAGPGTFAMYKGNPSDSLYFETHPFVAIAVTPFEYAWATSVTVYTSGPLCTGTAYATPAKVFDLVIVSVVGDDFFGPTMYVPTDVSL